MCSITFRQSTCGKTGLPILVQTPLFDSQASGNLLVRGEVC